MSRFFARVFALILAAAAFAAAAAILVQLRPEGAGGWGLIAALGVGTVLLPVIVYRVILSPFRHSGPPNEGEGAGLAMGAGIDSARRRDGDDPDLFGD
ncbi:MAG: hypothetical protein NXI12_12385 [Alphaproteobacteria bacterium]|nr:hypothetical protein [Alphaproteobacteria bacterium]